MSHAPPPPPPPLQPTATQPGVVVSYIQNDTQKSRMVGAFKAAGIQIAGGVPFKLDEPIDARAVTFRLGLFGIDKLFDVDMCVAKLEAALDIYPTSKL